MPIEAQIVSFVPTQENMQSLSGTYGDVYAVAPWNEAFRSKCGRFFGPENYMGDPCPADNCDVLESGYPIEETADMLLKEISRPNTFAKVVMAEGKISGFGIGFPYSYEQFVMERYKNKAAQTEMMAFFESVGLRGDAYYISEVGLIDAVRGQRLSSRLVDSMAKEAKGLGLPLLMRTLATSVMVENADRVGMAQIMGPRSIVEKTLVPNGVGMKTKKEIVVLDKVVRRLDPIDPRRVVFGSPSPR